MANRRVDREGHSSGQGLTFDQLLREPGAARERCRGTEKSAEDLVGPPERMESDVCVINAAYPETNRATGYGQITAQPHSGGVIRVDIVQRNERTRAAWGLMCAGEVRGET